MYDLIIIGAGPAGYTAAKKAADLGKSVCIIEKAQLGGVCLNEGCIPTKFMIGAAKMLSSIKKSAHFGIDAQIRGFNFSKMLENRDELIGKLRKSIEGMLAKAGIKIITGEAKLLDKNTVSVSSEKISAKCILIATGSRPAETKELKIDHKNILSSTDLLNIKEVPQSLIIIGAGYIGCELACIFREFGCDVAMVEIAQQILPGQDVEIAKTLMLSMKKRGINISLGTTFEHAKQINAQKILLAIGRRPNTENLGLEAAGIKLRNGYVTVNDKLQANISNIYAIGDVAGNFLLAHTAYFEAEEVIKNIFQKPKPIDYRAVPCCIYTMPEAASAGLTEAQAQEKGFQVETASYSFRASAKAHIIDETEGLVKLVCDFGTGRILGAQICGPLATELIGEIVVAINNNMTASDLARTIHAHPTLSEAIKDASVNIK